MCLGIRRHLLSTSEISDSLTLHFFVPVSEKMAAVGLENTETSCPLRDNDRDQ